jgi:hypothetical protein
MTDWKELFPVEGIAPLIGGILLWIGLNWLYIAPEIIGPRLAQKYYLPVCREAVSQGRIAREQQVATLRTAAEERLQRTMAEVQGRMQAATGNILGQIFGGRPGSAEFMDRYGSQMGGWVNNNMAPALQQRYQQERAAIMAALETEQREARSGIIHATPERYCGCAVTDAMKDRIELAAYTASLRIYTPAAVRRLEDGSYITEAGLCGKPPIA